jgi:uncharacterized protein YjaG (DUF416 family)
MDIFEEEIKRQLIPLTYEKKLLFALLTCEKLYPNYLYFESRSKWGNSNILLQAIELMYQSLFIRNLLDDEEVNLHINAVDLVTPDTEDFVDSSVSFALDACTAVYSSLKFMLNQDINHVVEVAIYARDTVFAFDNSGMDSTGSDNKAANAPLMQEREMTRQINIIRELNMLGDVRISNEFIHRLREGLPIIELS